MSARRRFPSRKHSRSWRLSVNARRRFPSRKHSRSWRLSVDARRRFPSRKHSRSWRLSVDARRRFPSRKHSRSWRLFQKEVSVQKALVDPRLLFIACSRIFLEWAAQPPTRHNFWHVFFDFCNHPKADEFKNRKVQHGPRRKGSFSNHQFSGVNSLLVSGRVMCCYMLDLPPTQ